MTTFHNLRITGDVSLVAFQKKHFRTLGIPLVTWVTLDKLVGHLVASQNPPPTTSCSLSLVEESIWNSCWQSSQMFGESVRVSESLKNDNQDSNSI